jgi:hypothetical protein
MDIDKLSARGKRKHIIRLCTRARIRAEREALGPVIPPAPQWASDAWGSR